MRKFVIFAIVCLFSVSAFGAVELSDVQNRIFQLTASGWVPLTQTAANGLNINFRAQEDTSIMINWLKIQAGQSGSLALVFPNQVYAGFLNKFQSFSYGNLTIQAAFAAPTNCTPSAGTVTCDTPTNGKTLTLFSWNGAVFTDTEKEASSGVFSGVSGGNYVVGYTGDEFCSTYITVP